MVLITLTSPATDAGKTFIAVGIAEAAAYLGLKVLFIELDNPVGDSLRVFGIKPKKVYPTIATWMDHDWEECLKTKNGTYLLPKPDMLHESIEDVAGLLRKADSFDLIVVDLGTDFRQKFWKDFINFSNLAILVADCDEKALVRVQEFLAKRVSDTDWYLIANTREKKGLFPPKQIIKELETEVSEVLIMPHFPNVNNQLVKSFPNDSEYGRNILAKVIPSITTIDIKEQPRGILSEFLSSFSLPKLPKLPKKEEKTKQIKPAITKETSVSKPVTPVIKSESLIRTESSPKILLLGNIQINSSYITYDPMEAAVAIAEPESVKYAPNNIPLYVISKGVASAWMVTQNRPDAVLCSSVNEALEKIYILLGLQNEIVKHTPINQMQEPPKPTYDRQIGKTTHEPKYEPVQEKQIQPIYQGSTKKYYNEPIRSKLSVLPGTRSSGSNQTIPKGGAIYIVCPSRPAKAAEVSAQISMQFSGFALVCASGDSTAALNLGISKNQLITSDWRIPGSNAPIEHNGVTVWPVDPYKLSSVAGEVLRLVEQVKRFFSLTIIDCGASLDLCTRVTMDEGVLVLLDKEGDAADQAAQHWIKNIGDRNVIIMAYPDTPNLVEVDNGYIIRSASQNKMNQFL